MIEEVKTLLAERSLTRAAIIDDAFDEAPAPRDIEGDRWDRFFDDLTEEDTKAVAAQFGEEIDDADDSELRRNVDFIQAVWTIRSDLKGAESLFQDYVAARTSKLTALAPLLELLDELGVTYQTSGRTADANVSDVEILFLDLFLGFVEDDAAVAQAIARLKGVMAARAASPPIVVLMSQSKDLEDIAPKVRDEGELMGCQFRTLPKSRLKDKDLVSEQLHDLAFTRPDAIKLTKFITAWDGALDDLKKSFLQEIRTLDLADYASAQVLKLHAEGQPLGDYMLDLFDQRLHGMLEGDETLLARGQALNSIRWDAYPPAQFMPSAAFLELTDSLIFQHHARTLSETPLEPQLGDVWMAPPIKPRSDAKTPAPPIETQSRDVFAVLTQACDLQHKNTDRLLLLKGVARPYNVAPLEKAPVSSAVMRVGKVDYTIDWNPLLTETWLLKDLPRKRRSGFVHVRRLRLSYALQLQQAFIGKLGRVGTAAELPARHAVGIAIYFRDKSGAPQLLAEAAAKDGEAVCLVGRPPEGGQGKVEWLTLSPKLRETFRQALRDVAAVDLSAGGAIKLGSVRENPDLYRRLKVLTISRDKATRPLKASPFDILTVATPAQSPRLSGKMDANSPLLFEIDWG